MAISAMRGDRVTKPERDFILGMGAGREVRLLEVVSAALLQGHATSVRVVVAIERLAEEGLVARLPEVAGEPTRYRIWSMN